MFMISICMLTHQLILGPGLPVEVPHDPDLAGALPHCEHLVRVALHYGEGHGAPLGVLGAHPHHRGVAASSLANLGLVNINNGGISLVNINNGGFSLVSINNGGLSLVSSSPELCRAVC